MANFNLSVPVAPDDVALLDELVVARSAELLACFAVVLVGFGKAELLDVKEGEGTFGGGEGQVEFGD